MIANTEMEAVGFSAEPGATPRVKRRNDGFRVTTFDVLGVEPRLGRGVSRGRRSRCPAAMPLWCSGRTSGGIEFASDPSVLGRTIRLNGTEFTVIGVAPETFPGMLTFGHPDFYMPLAMARVFSTNLQKNFFEDRDDRELHVKRAVETGHDAAAGAQ